MEPRVFARHLISMLVQHLARLPWLVSAAANDEWAREALERIQKGGSFTETPDELYVRIRHPQCAVAVLAACYVRPDFHALETILSRIQWSGPLADPPVAEIDAYREVEGAALKFGVYQLRYQPHDEFQRQAVFIARMLRILTGEAETLSSLPEDEILRRLELLKSGTLSADHVAA